ncbi:MAG: zinc metallopeptidase [Lachnospiraceae bacterium]|nr:zinc metallopeptidase [Lachnospiraceae bacterium]
MYSYGYMDWTYIFVIIGAVISMAASAHVNGTFSKYSQIRSRRGLSGAEVAQMILRRNMITDVTVHHVGGNLTDHFDPKRKLVNLSDSVYGSTSVAAIGVAAHECGHVIQHHIGYSPIAIRSALVPAANLGSMLGIPICVLGAVIGGLGSMWVSVGLLVFSLSVLFHIVTLPVEFDASRRALIQIEENGMLDSEEIKMAKAVLYAAALTYVASATASIMQLLRLTMIFGGNRRRD